MAETLEGFIGLRFAGADGEHFGWARVQLTGSGMEAVARVIDYAFEMRPGEAILAGAVPEPASIVLFVCAGFALLLFASRRRPARQNGA
jgi:hypothetical protein